jgi:hypothetical protein
MFNQWAFDMSAKEDGIRKQINEMNHNVLAAQAENFERYVVKRFVELVREELARTPEPAPPVAERGETPEIKSRDELGRVQNAMPKIQIGGMTPRMWATACADRCLQDIVNARWDESQDGIRATVHRHFEKLAEILTTPGAMGGSGNDG